MTFKNAILFSLGQSSTPITLDNAVLINNHLTMYYYSDILHLSLDNLTT